MLTLHYVALQHFREPERALSGVWGRAHPKMLPLYYVSLQHFREPEKAPEPLERKSANAVGCYRKWFVQGAFFADNAGICERFPLKP